MHAIPYDRHYELLRTHGLTPLAAAVVVCRANKGDVSWVLRWLSTENPERDFFRERWMKSVMAENKERVWFPGYVDEGCYFYSSLLHRPDRTVFIKWQDIAHIFIQDGLDALALCLSSVPEKYGCRDIQAQSDMAGFLPFVQEVSGRFFGSRNCLENKFKPGGHPVRKFQVWPEERQLR